MPLDPHRTPVPATLPEAGGLQHIAPDAIRRQHKRVGIFLLAIAAVIAYFFMYRPVHAALAANTGLSVSLKAPMAVAFCLYLAVALFNGSLSTDEPRTLNAKGQPTLSRKGWWMATGVGIAMAVAVVGWYAFLYAIGFHLSLF